MSPSRIRQIIAWLQQWLKTSNLSPRVRPQAKVVPFKPLFGVDGESAPSNKAMNSAGISFCIRYVSTPDNSKNITASEARRLKRAGKGIVIVFETTARRAEDGFLAARNDAHSAIHQTNLLGLAGCPILFAVDFECNDLVAIEAYFKGIYSVLPLARIGAYGSYRVIRYLFMQNLISYGYQTYAWSSGLRDTRAQLYQFSNDHTIGGVSVDFDRAYSPDYGQYKGT